MLYLTTCPTNLPRHGLPAYRAGAHGLTSSPFPIFILLLLRCFPAYSQIIYRCDLCVDANPLMLMSLDEMGNVVDREFLARFVGPSVAGYISSRHKVVNFC